MRATVWYLRRGWGRELCQCNLQRSGRVRPQRNDCSRCIRPACRGYERAAFRWHTSVQHVCLTPYRMVESSLLLPGITCRNAVPNCSVLLIPRRFSWNSHLLDKLSWRIAVPKFMKTDRQFSRWYRKGGSEGVAQWLRCCATNRKVAGSIPNGVIGIFHWHNPSDRTMALVSTQPITEMRTRISSGG